MVRIMTMSWQSQPLVRKASFIGTWSTQFSGFFRVLTDNRSSSGDSLGSEVDQQKQVYDNAIDLHANSFLSLQHEVYGTASSFPKCRPRS